MQDKITSAGNYQISQNAAVQVQTAIAANRLPTIVEAFFVGATIENFAFLSANSHEYEWLSRAVPYVVENHLRSYLDGEHFLFTK